MKASLINRIIAGTKSVTVEFEGAKEELNHAIKMSGGDEKRLLVKMIFDALCTEDCSTLGNAINHKMQTLEGKLIFTLTSTGEQFRVWYSHPKVVGKYHVDSCGHGVLIGIYGDKEEVARYIADFLEVYPLTKSVLNNGSVAYSDHRINPPSSFVARH